MNWINLYIFQSRPKFVDEYANNDQTRELAMKLWNEIDNLAPWLIGLAAFIAVAAALYYYYPFNKKPGRRYRIRYWWWFLIGSLLINCVVSAVLLKYWIDIRLPNLFILYSRITILNIIYCGIMYVLFSMGICNFLTSKISSNAFLYFKK